MANIHGFIGALYFVCSICQNMVLSVQLIRTNVELGILARLRLKLLPEFFFMDDLTNTPGSYLPNYFTCIQVWLQRHVATVISA